MRLFGLAVLLALAAATLCRAAERPNVVLIVIDDLGRNDLGCYGSKFYRTPHIDRLAQEGARFTNAYAACPVCSPTRAAIMTGKYPARLHLTDWLPGRGDRPEQKLARPTIRQELPLEEVTLAEQLRSAGYATAHIGKWHLGGEGFGPQQQGFDLNIAGDHTGSPRSYFAPYRDRAGNVMPGLEDAPEGEYLTDRLTSEAEKFLEAHRDRPFFLYLSHYTVHIPLRAKEEIIAKYPGQLTPGKQSNPIYAAMIESMDESVGRILKKLDELKVRDNTIVLFTSDNGGLCTSEGPNTPATINAPLREGKGFLYEGGVRAPLIISWPGQIKPGSDPSTITSSIDLMPTILDWCGIEVPKGIDGLSLAAALQGGEEPKREAIYWHYPHYANQRSNPGGAVRAGDWKLIEYYENGRRELYNLRQDESESRNRIEEQPETAAKLAKMLDDWRRSVNAQAMRPNPDYAPNAQRPNGNVILPARWAEILGTQLRYEPLPHKDTLGYWFRTEDRARWEFEIKTPGTFRVDLLQGCGKGHGGSEVEVEVAGQKLTFTVEDTGHFQNFVRREIGQIALEKPGRYTLTVAPQSRPGAAVMDLREVRLVPVKAE